MKSVLLAALLLTVSVAAGQTDEKPASPTAVVSFEHAVLSQNESAKVEVWFFNATANEVSVDLTISSSSLMQWSDGDSCQNPRKDKISLGKLAAWSSMHHTLCVKAAPEVVVGDYNVLFVLEYSTLTQPPKGGLISIEKQIKLSFLGSDSVAGVPLAFSCFIIPGVLFWLALGLTKGSAPDTNLGEKTIYSILVSLLIIAVGSAFHQFSHSHSAQFSLSAGVSIGKLVRLSIIGVVGGLATGGIEQFWRWKKKRKTVHPDDDEQTVLKKLLQKYSGVRKPLSTVQLSNNEEYEGSLCTQTDTHTVLIGWFSVEPPAAKKAEAQGLHNRNDLCGIMRWAHRNQVRVKQYRPIRAKRAGKMEDSTEYMKFWKNEDVQDARPPTAGQSPEEALTVE